VLYGRGMLAVVRRDSAMLTAAIGQMSSTDTDRSRFLLLQAADLFMSEGKVIQAREMWRLAGIGQNHPLVARLIETARRYSATGKGTLADEVYRTVLDISSADDHVLRQQALILRDVYGDY